MTFKIAVGGFHHETNTFSPANTDYDAFLKQDGWPGLTRGDAILQTLPNLNLPISGFLKAASEHEIVPTTWANAEPYGRVTKAAFERISTMILNGLPPASAIDAVYLDLHGAMVTEHLEDGEGEILRLVRDTLGPDLPVVISLDFHANVTPDMVELSDAITVFRTYPHVDMASTGERAFQLIDLLLRRGEKFHKAYRQIPYLIPLHAQHTGAAPCNRLYDQLPTLVGNGVTSIDFACGFPPADIYDCGPALVAYGTSAQAAERAVDTFFSTVVDAEAEFTTALLTAAAAVEIAIGRGKPGEPVIIADVQDNSGAGGSADTTALIRALIAQRAQQAVIGCLWDSAAAARAHAAGYGAKISLALGGKNGPDGEAPLAGEFIVDALSDGKFTCHGDMLNGIELDLGPMALLRVCAPDCDIRIAVASERFQCLDQGLFKELGIEPKLQAIVAVKSTVHFRADFEAIAAEILLAECPGANPCNLESVPYRNLRPGLRLGPNSSRISGKTS